MSNIKEPSSKQKHDGADRLAAELSGSANQFDFFQALRRVESLAGDLPRLGHAQQAQQERVRIGQAAALDFAPATIDQIDLEEDGTACLVQRFFGLLGPGGPLPLHMTQQVRDQVRHENDETLQSFLNLFHHRMAMLFYRAWSSSRGAIQRDRPHEDRFAVYLSALSGAMPLADGSVQPDSSSNSNSKHLSASALQETRWHFTGRFGPMHRNAEGLEAVVTTALGADAKVRSFVLRLLRLQPEDRTLLGDISTGRPIRSESAQSPAGRGGRLGRSVVLGSRVADRRSMIELKIGPIVFSMFRRLLPGGSLHQNLRELLRSYLDPGIDCRVRLILDRQTVPRMSLGRQGSLGRNAWVYSRSPKSHLVDCQFLV